MKTIINRLLLCLLLCGTALGADAAGDRLFRIERSLNKNIVVYDAQLKGNGLDTKNPINVYWLRNQTQEGLVKELSMIERKLAFGYKVVSASPTEATVTLTACSKRKIKVAKRSGKWTATVTINGKECILDHIYVKSKGSMAVEYIELHGKTLNGGVAQKERMNN